MLNGLDLFSGIGGISLALREWVRPISYCEIDPFCQAVLLSRMAENQLSTAPIWDDIRTFPIFETYKQVDIIYGGFPCQDISVAGNGKGLEGERSGLFYEVVRLAKEIKPKMVFLENVPAITVRGGIRVVRTFAEMGYDCRWCVISAASVGALHKRERWFLLAHAKHDGTFTSETRGSIRESIASGQQHIEKESVGETERTSSISSYVAHSNSMWKPQSEGIDKKQWKRIGNSSEDVAHSKSQGLERQRDGTECAKSEKPQFARGCDDGNTDSLASEQADKGTESEQTESGAWRVSTGQYWPFESREHWQETVQQMDKCTDGVQFQMARLRALGNSVVPQQVKEAFKILMGIK